MLRDSPSRETRTAFAHFDRDAILGELERILTSPHFCNSKRYPALLRYIVECTLDGKSDSLKERTLGVEIFGRPPDYDTNSDTIVRYTAGEVRKRLLLYYSEEDHRSEIRILLGPGSYVPEFQRARRKPSSGPGAASPLSPVGDEPAFEAAASHQSSLLLRPSPSERKSFGRKSSLIFLLSARPWIKPLALSLAVAILMAAAFGAWNWRQRPTPAERVLSEFWAPVADGQQQVLICTGGVVFNQGTYSGTRTANQDVEYPFISLQNAAAIARVSGQFERYGISTQLIPSPSTPLTNLREHSVALIGGYNNQWTMRLLEPIRFHFSPEPLQSIVDATRPQFRLQRDRSQPYSSADDYALVARYRDPVTDGWVVVLAGIGRNGTEAAADFATDSHYLQLLRRRLGVSFANRNVEAILRVNVVDGKTGAPSIVDAYSW